MTSNTFTTMQIRRSATAVAPTTLANGEFGFSFVSNTLYIGSPANTPIIITSNAEINAANMANSGLTNIAANGTITTLNTSQINFNNTATMNISTVANGTGTDVAWSANLTAIAGGINNYQVDILANGSLTLGNANINFNNTSTINVGALANGTGQANIQFDLNTSMNIISLNVVSNIANVGNIAVTQNGVFGNINVTGISMNVKQNLFAGNITAAQNISSGNINVTGISCNVKQNLFAGNATVAQNLTSGNGSITQNISTGNATITQNISTGNASITTNLSVSNITMNSVSFIPTWTTATVNASGTSVSGQNCFTGTITGSDTAGFWVDPFNFAHLRGLLANSGAGNIAAYAGSPAMNSNIANNFPVPTTNVYVTATARCNGNGILNVCTVLLAIYNNNAMQMINVAFANGQPATQALSWNIANISLYGITYSRA